MHKLSNKLYLNMELLTPEQIRAIKKAFVFHLKQDEFIQLFETLGKWLIVPPNAARVEQAFGAFEYEDLRIAPTVKEFHTNLKLRPHQEVFEQDLEKFNFNAVAACPTSFGKTVTTVYFCQKLKTPSLFIGSMRTHIDSFIKEVKAWADNWQEVLTIVDSKWKGQITPIMVVTLKYLQMNPEVVKKLNNEIGFLIADEIHTQMTSTINREILFSFKPKYRLFLSATPEHKVKGFVQSVLSANVVEGEETTEHTTTVIPVYLPAENYVFDAKGNWHEIQAAYYKIPEFKLGMAEVVDIVVNKLKRGMLLYNETDFGQNVMAEACERVGAKYVLINSKASNAEKETAIAKFDAGEYDVIIGGKSITASISAYRASVAIFTDLGNKNELSVSNASIQLIGRLKRKNANICDKSKIFIDLMHGPSGRAKFRNLRYKAYMEESAKKDGMIKMLKERTAVDYNIAKAIGLS